MEPFALRKKTRVVHVGNVAIGGEHPIVVQSMTKTGTSDTRSTIRQIKRLEAAGCEIVRLAVPNMEAAKALGRIKKLISIPLIADVHFDWRLALKAIERGIDGLRINPGNIGAQWKILEIIRACRERGIPIRIGVNAGSLERDLLRKYGHPTPEALVESAGRHVHFFEDHDFTEIKISLKASDVPTTVEAYRLFSRQYSYPLHIGISEAGPPSTGIIKSSVGIGILLAEGIGDTIRVSLTASPEEEVRVAYSILGSLGLRQRGVNIISCPMCGRCSIALKELVRRVERETKHLNRNITIAVMGCIVNGPGEAKGADIGIAGTKGRGILFRKGEVIKSLPEEKLLDALLEELASVS